MDAASTSSCSRRLRRITPGSDEDSISATHSTQTLLAKRLFVVAIVQVLDGVKPLLMPWYRALLDCL